MKKRNEIPVSSIWMVPVVKFKTMKISKPLKKYLHERLAVAKSLQGRIFEVSWLRSPLETLLLERMHTGDKKKWNKLNSQIVELRELRRVLHSQKVKAILF